MSRAPSILICAQHMSAGAGGIAEVARLTAKSLGRRHAVRALACLDRQDFLFEGAPVESFRGSRLAFVAKTLTAARGATHVIYDFAGTARAGALSLGRRRPSAIWAHGIEVWDDPRAARLRALSRADLILVNSEYTRERARRALGNAERIRVCPLGTADDEAPAFVGPSAGRPTVLIFGRLDAGLPKGHDLLIAAWPRIVSAIPEARLLVSGGGPGLDSAKALASHSPARASIVFTGFVPDDKVEALWGEATLMAMPSRKEGFGLVYVEAMRHGVPVVASTEDAGQEVNIDGATGFNVPRDRPDALADTLIGLLRDRDLCARLGAQGAARWRDEYCFSRFDERLRAATADFLASP